MLLSKSSRTLLAVAISGTLLLGGSFATDAVAAPPKQEAPVAKFPNATRAEPKAADLRVTQGNLKRINKIVGEYADATKSATVLADVDAILSNAKSSAYDKAFVTQMGGLVANRSGDNVRAVNYFKAGLAANALANNEHFDLMYNMAIVQTQAKDYVGATETLNRFIAETGGNPEAKALMAQNLYETGKFAEAAATIKQAMDAKPGNAAWNQLYMVALDRSGNKADALVEAEKLAKAEPTNKTAQANYAALLQQTGKDKEAAAVMQQMRANNLLTTDTDYRNLFLALAPVEGAEKTVIDIITEGLEKNILTPDYNVYAVLAQSYYYTGQEAKAIEFYEKAAPLAKNGATYLNLARIYWQQGKNVLAKSAAVKAEAKGGLTPGDTKTMKEIKALPDQGGKSVIIKK